MTFLDKILYTNKFSKINNYLLLLLRLFRKKNIVNAELIDICKEFTKIGVLASGPSLNKCMINEQTIYFTTNSSYLYFKKKINFIHFIKDINYLKKFLLFGLKYKPNLVIIEIFTHSKGKGSGKLSLEVVKKYLGKRNFKFPIIVTNNENLININSKNYYNNKISFLNLNNLKNPDSNSGLMIYSTAIWITSIVLNIKECEIYGLDAGEGGEKYYNGLKTLSNHVAMRDENKDKMGFFIENSQSKFTFIKNFSYFKNNIN